MGGVAGLLGRWSQKDREEGRQKREAQHGCGYGPLSSHGFCPVEMCENPVDLPSVELVACSHPTGWAAVLGPYLSPLRCAGSADGGPLAQRKP